MKIFYLKMACQFIRVGLVRAGIVLFCVWTLGDIPHFLNAGKIDATGCGKRPLLMDNGLSEISDNVTGSDGGSAYIIKGEEAVPFSWPFVCRIRGSSLKDICAGTLVKNKVGRYFFVTAAHCVDGWRGIQCEIHKLGGDNRSITLDVGKVFVHPYFDWYTFENDIAIFEVGNKTKDSPYLQPACIADTDYYDGENAIIVGWGRTDYRANQNAQELRQVKVEIYSDSTCKNLWGWEFYSDVMLCAGKRNETGGSCYGDSGGPIFTYRQGSWTLTGIVSWGSKECDEPEYPPVFTDVYRFNRWIDQTINK